MLNRRFSSSRRRRLSRINVGVQQQKRGKSIAASSTKPPPAHIGKSLENFKNETVDISATSFINPESYECVQRHRSLIPNIKFGSISDFETDDETLANSNKSNELLLGHNLNSRRSISPSEYQSGRNSLSPEDSFRMTASRKSSTSSPLPLPELSLSPRNSLSVAISQRYAGPRTATGARNSLNNSNTIDSMSRNESRPSVSCRTSPRGSLAQTEQFINDKIVSRNSLGTLEFSRSPKNSYRPNFSLASQGQNADIPRRYSADSQQHRDKKLSLTPHRSASIRVNYKFNNALWTEPNKSNLPLDSRRTSSNVSIYELKKKMSNDTDTISKHASSIGMGINLTTYDSVAYQLKDAHIESNNICDFVIRALDIVNRTLIVSSLLVCLSSMPLVMLIMGSNFFRDCPIEPNIPLYMVVAGSIGCIKMVCMLWSKFVGDQCCTTLNEEPTSPSISMLNNFLSISLTIFLVVWFIFANHWIWSIYWPDFQPTLFEPNQWCHRTLYVFSLVHLAVVYTVIIIVIIFVILFSCCHLFHRF